jgi:hypothetical protein
MTLTFTCTLAVTADQLQVHTMLFGALGCNLAWGTIDAGVYLLTRINIEGRAIATVRAIRERTTAMWRGRSLAPVCTRCWRRRYRKIKWN